MRFIPLRVGFARLVLLVVVAAAGCRPPGYGQDDQADDQGDVDAAPTGDGPGAPDAAQPDAGPAPDAAACTAGFSLAGHASAATVWLSGDWIAWAGTPEAGAIEMVRGVDGVWRVDVGFAPGEYQYKYIVDGTQWIPDPGNAHTVPDGLGGVNSVFTCP
jgi:hypothetical protein